jgi:hypothetical protein
MEQRVNSRWQWARRFGCWSVVGALLVAGVGAVPARAAANAPSAPQVDPSGEPQIASLSEHTTYALSPQLAAMLGTDRLTPEGLARLRAAARPELAGEKTPPVGTTLLWPALDIVKGIPPGIYLKQYTLRAVGDKVEVWVASGCDLTSCGTAFPAGDCRDRDVPGSTTITDDQVKYLIGIFDGTIYPKETAAFSTPPDHNGSATIPGLVPLGLDFSGNGEHTVTLVDNVRDENFYDFPKNQTYIAGFFAPVFNQLTDRNVMTIDAFDWLHRTGAHPQDAPNDDPCKSRPGRPFTYEAVFAHEWQHLLEHYQDPAEFTWVNEGLSMFAEALDKFADVRPRVNEASGQGQMLCFQGFGPVKGKSNHNPRPCGGPQNSLTTWGDELSVNPDSILADYGNAWSFMLYLYDHYGLAFMSDLHRDGAHQGLASVQFLLDKYAHGTKVADLLHNFQLGNLLGGFLDHRGKQVATVSGIGRDTLVSKDIDATLNLADDTCYALAGAAPNGADYVRLRDANGKYLTGAALRALSFSGDQTVIVPKADGSQPLALGGDNSGGGPASVQGWYVSLVGIDATHHRALVLSHPGFSWNPTAQELKRFARYGEVVAVVAHDDTADESDDTSGGEQYADYALKANDNVQPGG